MVQDYLKERYNVDLVAFNFNDYIQDLDATCYMTGFGFVVYKLQGDAAIIYDMYVKPEYRGHTYAWVLHNHVMKQAEQAKKAVAITFSEFKGQNHMSGIKAMKVAGFMPAFKTNDEFVFIKGI